MMERSKMLKFLIGLALVWLLSLMIVSFQVQSQTAQKIVTTYDSFGLTEDSGELQTYALLTKWARAGLLDTVLQAGEWHFQMYAPRRAVWIDLPEHFNSAILDLPDNILKKDFILYDDVTEEAIIPDSLYYEEWTFSQKAVKEFRIKKTNNDHFVYHNLSPGFLPAKHKSDLDKKAKKEKEKKEKKQ